MFLSLLLEFLRCDLQPLPFAFVVALPIAFLHSSGLDCEQSLSSPNFSEVGELASEPRAARSAGAGKRLFCIIYSFPLARRI